MTANKLENLPATKQQPLFAETVLANAINNDLVKRYYMNFPQYPFRTLNPRDLNILATSTSSSLASKLLEFDSTSPLFPAHTQMNIVFTKRKNKNLINCMLPWRLDAARGSNSQTLTNDERNAALTMTTVERNAQNQDENINWFFNDVEIIVEDCYLQVRLPRRGGGGWG